MPWHSSLGNKSKTLTQKKRKKLDNNDDNSSWWHIEHLLGAGHCPEYIYELLKEEGVIPALWEAKVGGSPEAGQHSETFFSTKNKNISRV